MAKRRHVEDHEEGGHSGGDERWLLTYADMITLLLALFIVLFSVSTINQKKFEALALGLKQTFNPSPGVLSNSNGLLQNSSLVKTEGNAEGKSVRTAGPDANTRLQASATAKTAPPSTAGAPNTQAQLAAIEARVAAALAAKGLSSAVSQSLGTGQLTIQLLDDKVFFQSDSADLGTEGDLIVDTVASVLAPAPNLVDVNGYTDNQAITGGPYRTNEELSAMRAVNVVLRLSGADAVDPSRLVASGFGDTHPAAPNDNPRDMALNRRIDLVVLAVTGA